MSKELVYNKIIEKINSMINPLWLYSDPYSTPVACHTVGMDKVTRHTLGVINLVAMCVNMVSGKRKCVVCLCMCVCVV